ncbi:MAG: tyrosine-type recombinase/integrase [Streptosporangiaceae bacterium]
MRSSIYADSRGYWHGRVTVGIRDDGRPDRRHVGGKTRADVAEKVRALERQRDQGAVRKAGEKWTVGRWLTYWVENIAAPPNVTENTHNGYLVDVNKHLIPGLGAHRLDRLEPDHLEKLYARMQSSGLSAGTAHHVHRTVRAALNEAVRRRHLPRNPVLLARAPQLDEDEVEPYDVPEIQRLLEAAARRRNSARWALALALGLRQGEALGLTWDDVNLDKGAIRIRRSRNRPKYEHGCGDTCGKSPGYCPQRVNIRPATGGVKSRAGRRTVGLPPQLVALLRNHRAAQEQDRAEARELWHDEGWVFAGPTGDALNPNTDYHEWKRLLREAGLREGRLHDARHTAATVLLVLRQPTPTVMSLMGWSSESMAARYQHVTDAMRSQVASQVGELIWDSAAGTAAEAAVTVPSGSLAAVLAVAEQCIASHHTTGDRGAGALAALAELRAALPSAAGSPETANETKTETKEPAER